MSCEVTLFCWVLDMCIMCIQTYPCGWPSARIMRGCASAVDVGGGAVRFRADLGRRGVGGCSRVRPAWLCRGAGRGLVWLRCVGCLSAAACPPLRSPARPLIRTSAHSSCVRPSARACGHPLARPLARSSAHPPARPAVGAWGERTLSF